MTVPASENDPCARPCALPARSRSPHVKTLSAPGKEWPSATGNLVVRRCEPRSTCWCRAMCKGLMYQSSRLELRKPTNTMLPTCLWETEMAEEKEKKKDECLEC